MSKVFGIDLGTTYSCIAYIDPTDQAVVLKNAEGDLTTPSAVWFDTAEDVQVGISAKEAAKTDPEKVVTFIKRYIGQAGYVRNIDGVDLKPEEISSYILRKVVNDAEETLRMEGKLDDNEHVNDVVITCPAYFGLAERTATETAGKLAGLNVLAIINEPTAAAISYGLSNDRAKTVLVYDLGGGTFDVTIVKVDGKQIRVVATGGDKELGGKDWDDRILTYLADEYKHQSGTNDEILDDEYATQELLLDVEKNKKLLTSKEKTPISINFKGNRQRIELTREKFDELTSDLVNRTISLTRQMFEEAAQKGFRESDIDEILLVGGSSRMPQIMKAVKEAFGKDVRMFDPDEAVAKGAAIYAAHLNEFNLAVEEIAAKEHKSVEEVKEEIDAGKLKIDTQSGLSAAPLSIVNVSSRTYGVRCIWDGKESLLNLIFKNQDLPAHGENTLYPVENNQRNARFEILESFASDEHCDPSVGTEIGHADLELPSGITQRTPIEVTFTLDESGLLKLKGVEKLKGRTVEATFETANAMSDVEMKEATNRIQSSNIN